MPPTTGILAAVRDRRVALVALAAAVALLGGVLFFVRAQAPWLTDPAAVRAWVRSFGPLAPAAFVALQATQVVVAPIPGQVLGLVSGYLFGALAGTTYSLLGATIGSYVAFVLARRLGRPFVERIVAAESLAAFDRHAKQQGALALFLVFLVPGLPDDVICFVAGLTELSIPRMLAISFVGRIPGYAAINLVGAGFATDRVVEAAAVLAVLAVVSVIAYGFRDRLLDRLLGPQR